MGIKSVKYPHSHPCLPVLLSRYKHSFLLALPDSVHMYTYVYVQTQGECYQGKIEAGKLSHACG